ncbi:MAG: type VI secretion system tip protein VgrG [Holosporales bacterium]|nr:type VI secretion system tip protein VgrG [Holosporales bacterium]
MKLKCSAITEAVIMKAEITEFISSLFRADVFLQTARTIDIEKIINLPACVSLKVDNKLIRYFSGIIETASFENVPNHISKKTDSILYIRIVPTLTRTVYSQKYRIFQELSTKEIIQKILKENNVTNIELNLRSAGNEKRIFCVQYGESDFHFISRLMEEEGIFYYFKHDEDKDTMEISDFSPSAVKINTELQIKKIATNATLTTDSVYNVSFSSSIGTKRIDIFSYSEMKADVISGTASDRSGAADFATKEFCNQIVSDKEAANILSKTILESENSFIKKLTGNSYCPELYPGVKFKISGSFTKTHNGDFFTISVKHFINQIPEVGDVPIYYNSLTAIPNEATFRSANTHLKNRIFGCQTATVTGLSGEEVFCDENARIKVKFHWDSRTEKDEKSSCWIRVGQSWAGSKFGTLTIPRVGMEVLISFIDGDPDQPIVTGCLYNGVNKSPSNYAKEQNTISTLYTNSSKGEGFNELRFNDKAEEEEIFIHAQKDVNAVIENSFTETINEGSKTTILESKKDPIEHSITIKKGKNTITINEGDYVVLLDKGNQTITLKDGNQAITLSKGDLKIDITGSLSIRATKDINIESESSINLRSTGATLIDSKDVISIKSVKDFKIDCMKHVAQVKMAVEISSLSFKVDAKNSVEINGLSVKAAAKTSIEFSAIATATIKSTAMLQLQGSAGVSIQGAMIKLN